MTFHHVAYFDTKTPNTYIPLQSTAMASHARSFSTIGPSFIRDQPPVLKVAIWGVLGRLRVETFGLPRAAYNATMQNADNWSQISMDDHARVTVMTK